MTKACWGLTTESGGQLSHGAVVAREYGMPATAGMPGPPSSSTTGRLVVLDGLSGQSR